MNSKGFYILEEFINKFGSLDIEYIVSSEDKNIQKDFYEELKDLSKKEKIIFFNRTENIKDIEDSFEGYKFAIGWRWMIRNSENLIVFHDSLLPKYRGFAPVVNSLINNEKEIGVTALFASSEYDKGNIISQKNYKLNYPIKISLAIQKIKPLYFELLSGIFTDIKNNKKIKSIKQDESKSTYSLWLDNEDYFIDWSWSVEKIKRFVDAVGYPYDNAKAYLEEKIIKFIDVEIIDDVFVEHRERHIGKIIFKEDNIPVVVCKNGLIALKNITDENDCEVSINFRSRFK